MADNQKALELEFLLKQHSLRQAELNKHVLDSIQQAMTFLQQAQKALVNDLKLHEQVNQSGDLSFLAQSGMDTPFHREPEQIPAWILETPPELH